MRFARSAKQVVHWDRLKTPVDHAAFAIATALGAGLFPKAPGTMGAIFGLPLAYWLSGVDVTLAVAVIAGLTAAGTWSAKHLDTIMGTGDNQIIVMDEVIGVCITALTIERNPVLLFVAFVLFRFFDIVKIPPVRAIDRWSKNKGAWAGGFGVMADDIVAGLQGLFVIWGVSNLVALYFPA
ncbi:MAG: phosphatidylglycerophosphatase A [Bacteriovoracia bacterium]